MLGHVIYTATHFGFVIICFFTGRKKGAVSCLYRTDDRNGHCKFRLDCRIKKKAKDGPLALLVHIMLDKVSVFPVSIPPEDLPSKKTWHLAMIMAWVRELCGLQVLHRVNWLCFPSFYSNIYDYTRHRLIVDCVSEYNIDYLYKSESSIRF